MKKFFFNIILFSFVLSCFYGVIFITTPFENYGADYVRVASPKYSSLILGSSMAARGLSPAVIQQSLGDYYVFPMMNFSFNIGTSAYGEVYYNRIAEKLKENMNKTSLFIVSVDPYTIGDFETTNGNDRREYHGVLAQLKSVTSQPNWEYFFKYILLSKRFVTLNIGIRKTGVDEYGFDPSDLDMETHPTWKVRENIEKYILPYYKNDVIPNYRPSKERLAYLEKTINLLKENGDVFLIRMPFNKELFELTNTVYPNFDRDMQELARTLNVHYLSFWDNPSKYKTTDGVHLYRKEAERISKDISDLIKEIKMNSPTQPVEY